MLEDRPGAALCAGGTDLLVRRRAGLINPESLICLERIEELQEISFRGDTIFVGACARHARIIEHPVLKEEFPILIKAIRVLGSPPIRNMGTIGGNICTASPAGDALPPLYVLEAEVEIRSRNASRRMVIDQFIQGPGRTALEQGEMLHGIWLRRGENYPIHHFEKVGLRKALAISVASLSALVSVSKSGLVEKVRLAWGSVAPTVLLAREAEEALLGRPLSREALERAAVIVRRAASPIGDIRGTEEYRRTVAGNLLLRLLQYAN